MILPKLDKIVIPEEKFTEYALNPERAPDKAFAFRAALGYGMSNMYMLIGKIRKGVHMFEAVDKGGFEYGTKYEVVMKITGANGRSANVLTAWLDDAETGVMRLTSLYVTNKKARCIND